MFSMRNISLCLGMLSSACFGMQKMQVLREQSDFMVLDGDAVHPVQRHDISKMLRSLSPEKLQQYEELGGRYKAIKLSNGDYMVNEKGDLKGGFFLTAALAVTGTLVAGGVATLGATAGGFLIGGPAGAAIAAVATAKATCAAAVYVAIVTTAAPLP